VSTNTENALKSCVKEIPLFTSDIMHYVGISCGFHDGAISVIDTNGYIVFAGHSERYTKIKNDKDLCVPLILDALSYVNGDHELHYYERPWLKYLRQLRSGENPKLSSLFAKNVIGEKFMKMLGDKKIHTQGHHLCHAAGGFQTSPFNDATVVVIDAIGEFDTISIWDASYDSNGVAQYKKRWGKKYPDSIGLFYSAMTKRVGLRPLDEEYILMGMSAYGEPKHVSEMLTLFNDSVTIDFKENLHIGVDDNFIPNANEMDIASSAQHLTEWLIKIVMSKARELGLSRNLVYGGGVALNCLANRLLGDYFENIWIMPNPGDAGNSLGAACLGYGKRVDWNNAFLGYNIPGNYPTNMLLDVLLSDKIVGVANGRAEFGPRALGNRSLLADPRGNEIKDKVNEIKRRQKFRPFAPIILEEMVHDYFIMPDNWNNSRYMQVVGTCRFPDLFPAIVHHDGTSRIQTVPKDGSGIRELLEKWYVLTGCPILLNTSLNIRGEPMVNDCNDADRFEKLYGITVLS
jgi:carbamoyltransferase